MQPVSADPRPLDAAFKRRTFEVREVCANNGEKIPIAPHPTNGDEARSSKNGSDSRGLPTTNTAKWIKRRGRRSTSLASRAIQPILRKSRSAALANWSIPLAHRRSVSAA